MDEETVKCCIGRGTEREGEKGRDGQRERGREREHWESEWEFLSGNRTFTVSYYTKSRERGEELMVGRGTGGSCSPALF
mgnify:CR=1 FL=1